MLKSDVRAGILIICALVVGFLPGSLWGQSITDFEGFTTGVSVDGQGGWRSMNASRDEEIIDLSGNKAWRVSNAFANGSFGDQPFAPGSNQYAGETGSIHEYDSAVANTNRFYASFDFWSVTGAAQPGLDITISPDDGAGRRQSFISLEDDGTGINIDFYDTQNNDNGANANEGFVQSYIANGLSYATKHHVVFDITFVDGHVESGGIYNGNDIVDIYVDGVLVHTGTTWESYWQTTTEGQTPPSVRAVDTLLFRVSTGAPSTAGGGFYFDNVYISDAPPRVTNLNSGAHYQTIQSAIDAANAGDTLSVSPGTYNESPSINKSVTLQSSGGRDMTTIVLQNGPTYLGAMDITGTDVVVDGFTIQGFDGDAGSSLLASSNVTVAAGLGTIELRNNRFLVGKVDSNSNGDDGIGLLTVYNTSSDTTQLTVADNIFEPVGTEGQRAFYINPGVDGFTFTGNTINGNFVGTSITQAKTGLVENSTLTGVGAAGNRSGGLGTWGYPDPTMYGATTFRANTIMNARGISLYDTSSATIENNTLSDNDGGVQIIEVSFPALDISGLHINGNSIEDSNGAAVSNGSTSGGTADASGNWWGSNVSATIASATSGAVDFTPWLDSGADTDGGTAGFQGDLSILNVDDDSPQSGATGRIQEGIDSVSGSTVNVLPGTYPGNISVADDVTLQSTGGAAVTTIAGAGGCAVTIDGDNVTIDGFTVTNPTGTNAICATDHNVIAIRNNIVTNVGGPSVGGNHHAVLIVCSALPVDDVTIEDNQINNVTGSEVLAQKGSASAITVGFSNGNENVTNLVIQNNTITDINGYTVPFGDGGRGAYGILINHGTGTTGMTVGAQILNNTITNLEGLWAHGIGLEGNTPNALLQGNAISDLTDYKMPSDAIGVQVEDNASASTVEIHYNSFTNMAVGIQNVTNGTTVNAENNYWGTDSGPNDTSDDAGETDDIDYLTCTGTPASEFNADGTGSAVNDTSMAVVDYCPWLLGQGKLALEIAGSCPDDASGEAGYQIEVQLWMRDLLDPATGYQAFVTYDDAKLSFRSDLSSYEAMPFGSHIGSIATADSGGLLSLNGFEMPGGGMGGTTADSLLATLVFDVDMSCTTTSLGFDTSPASELSFEGTPLVTGNQATPTVTLDDTAPTITPDTPNAVASCYASAAAAEADAMANTQVTDDCPGGVTVGTVAAGDCNATVTITATDDCGNVATYIYNTRIDDEDPMVTQASIDPCYMTQVDAETAALAATTATDNCTAPGMLGYAIQDVTGTCDKMITVRVTDECGNFTDVVYSTRVDNTPPSVTAGSIDSCYPTVAAAEAAAISATGIMDDCDGTPVVTASTVGTCTATVTVTVTDSCGNSDFVDYNTRIDNEAPVVTCGNVSTPADAGQCTAEVTLSATASDNCDGVFAAGSIEFIIDIDHDGIGNGADDMVTGSGTTYVFPSGTTDVRATATDSCGNVGTCDYTVTVDGVNLVNVVVFLDDVAYDGMRNIRFTAKGAGGCASAVCWPVTFADVSIMGDVKSMGMAQVEVPCGDWDEVCAKDEQHTLIDTVALTLNGTEFDGMSDLHLLSGDTDNDSDVDINDVTLFIAQFGMSVSGPNACPYNNVRDADFSLNGFVAAEDFSILQPNWLLFSACNCPSPLGGDLAVDLSVVPLDGVATPLNTRRVRKLTLENVVTRLDVKDLSPEVADYADLDGDGAITHRDIRAFEDANGLSHDLSNSLKKVEAMKAELDATPLDRPGVKDSMLRPRR